MSYISIGKSSRDFRTELRDITVPSTFMRLKRGCDIVLAIAMLPLLAVVCLVAFVLNPFLNPGSLFFTQVRIGQNEKPFRMIKLRTMTGSNSKANFATEETHRITRFGAFMRSKRIDELPQVINVLLGHMSFIGPRPEQPKFYQDFATSIPGYAKRQMVKPGISGLAQVESGYADDATGTRTKLRYDLHYIRNMGLRMDAYIIGQTFRVLVTGFGAR